MDLPASLKVRDPDIGHHIAIGDRRTGALVAADGTLDWWCLPDFDGPPIFDALLDGERGGYCRFGPTAAILGEQHYLPETCAGTTLWPAKGGAGQIEVTDLMAWPDDERADHAQNQRVVLRRLRVTDSARIGFFVRPSWNFSRQPATKPSSDAEVEFTFETGTLGVWTSFPLVVGATAVSAEWTAEAGEEHWVMLGWNASPAAWSTEGAANVFEAALRYWRNWSKGLDLRCAGDRADAARRAALTVHLHTHARHGTAVASLTTSLPERLGGDRNYDYRFAWVRDGSLALALLARLGKAAEVRCYFHWLAGRKSETDSPLQVVYGIDGRTDLKEHQVTDVRGYADSRPVQTGNRAAKQRQLGSPAFLADCVHIYLKHDGKLERPHWTLIERAADYTASQWGKIDSGVWELTQEAHYVASRVLCWVVLERAGWIAAHTGYGESKKLAAWHAEAARIHAEVMDRGWCEEKQSFRQRYDSDTLDAAALLIPLMRFLPPDHPRCVSTLAALESELMVDGLLHRFDPTATLGSKQLPIGEFEAAFLPCVFWHVHLLALLGRVDEARAILDRCDAVAGPAGIFAEELDARQNILLGNTPLLFSQVEYIRAAIAIQDASSHE